MKWDQLSDRCSRPLTFSLDYYSGSADDDKLFIIDTIGDAEGKWEPGGYIHQAPFFLTLLFAHSQEASG